eukprot:4199096-Alexandrium_andersonii.AAC.1
MGESLDPAVVCDAPAPFVLGLWAAVVLPLSPRRPCLSAAGHHRSTTRRWVAQIGGRSPLERGCRSTRPDSSLYSCEREPRSSRCL